MQNRPAPHPDTPCGHTTTRPTGTWTCTLTGPHDTTPDGRIRHYYVRAAA